MQFEERGRLYVFKIYILQCSLERESIKGYCFCFGHAKCESCDGICIHGSWFTILSLCSVSTIVNSGIRHYENPTTDFL